MLSVAGLAADLRDGLARAREAVATGAAIEKLSAWIDAQAGGAARRSAGEARLAALLGEVGLAS